MYLEPFYSFSSNTVWRSTRLGKDSLRYLYYNIDVAKVTCHVLKRRIEFQDVYENFGETIDDYNNLITTLNIFQQFLDKQKEKVKLSDVIKTKIRIDMSHEIIVTAYDSELYDFFKEQLTKTQKSFRIIRPHTLIKQFA